MGIASLNPSYLCFHQLALSTARSEIGAVPARIMSFNFNLLTFPTSVCGNEETMSTDLGTLYDASCSLQNRINSASLTVEPSFRTTTAFNASPHWGSGTPITTASMTSGCWYSTP